MVKRGEQNLHQLDFTSFNLLHFIRGGVTKKIRKKSGLLPNREGGGVSEGSKMPNLYFGVLKRVKNGLKMAKKHIEILYFS